MTKLSVAIVTHNEERNIAECIKSASFADEIVVVDGRSTDGTSTIAKKLGAKVFEVENQPLMKKTMNLAFEKCHGDWILSLDADERITIQLKEEIQKAISSSAAATAYRIPRMNKIFGKWIEHTFWYPDFQTRLFKRGLAKFPALNVHEELNVDGTIGTLKSPLEHFHYESVSQWIHKMDSYTTYESEKLINSGKIISWVDAIHFPFQEFLTRYFAKEGYRDGLHGLVLSLLMAFYWEVVFAKMWEKQGFFQAEIKSSSLETEFKKMSKDIRYWKVTREINESRGWMKTISRIERKLNNLDD